MQGSLERPPIVIRTDRRRAVLRLAVALLLGALMSPLARTDWRANGLLWIFIAIFGALGGASIWELIWPGRLVIDQDGFKQRDLWRTRRWPWTDVRRFRPASNRFYHFVGFEHVPTGRRRSGGIDGLNQDWEISPPALAELLNRARARWFGAG